MARLSQNLYRFSQDTFNTLGFGNPALARLFVIAAVLSFLGIIAGIFTQRY